MQYYVSDVTDKSITAYVLYVVSVCLKTKLGNFSTFLERLEDDDKPCFENPTLKVLRL